MSKSLGRQVNLKQDPPTSVEQMQDGEMRVGEDGILARVGPQVLQKSWMKTILYDDFEDSVIDPAWDLVWNDKNGGSHAETNGFMVVTTTGGGSGGRHFLAQSGILGEGDPFAVEGDWYFDSWGKMILPMVPDSNGFYAEIRFDWFLSSVAKDYVRFRLSAMNGNTQYQPSAWWYNGVSTRNQPQTAVDYGAGANELWWRFRYLPGDSNIRMFYHHGPENPFDSQYDDGWTEITLDKYQPEPAGSDELRVALVGWGTSVTADETIYFNEIAEWEGGQTTTTTTTTTTAPFLDFTDDTYWQDSGRPDPIAWSGTFWWPQIGNGIEGLEPIGVWSLGFRPTEIRITFRNSGSINLTVYDTENNVLGTVVTYLTGEALALTFAGYDIGEIIFDNNSSTIEYDTIEFR